MGVDGTVTAAIKGWPVAEKILRRLSVPNMLVVDVLRPGSKLKYNDWYIVVQVQHMKDPLRRMYTIQKSRVLVNVFLMIVGAR